MKRYTFDFDRFTVGHLAALSRGAADGMGLWAVNDLTVGGIYHLPMGELNNVLDQFVEAYNAFSVMVKTHAKQNEPNDDANLRDMLDGIEGLE